MNVRSLLLIAVAIAATAAVDDATLFVLRDGRRLVGSYDDRAGMLRLDGPFRAALRVRAGDIVRRESAPATSGTLSSTPTPVPTPRRPSAADGVDRRLATRLRALRLRLDDAESALMALRETLAVIEAEAQAPR